MAKTKGGKKKLSRQVPTEYLFTKKLLLLLPLACEKRLQLKFNSEGYK